MDANTIHAKAIADHTKVYEKIFSRVNIKDGDSILLITWLHPTYHNTIKKKYPHSFILSIEDIGVKFLWRNVLDGVVFLDLEDKESLIKYTKENKMKFDHIIANPPYSLGNQITSVILNNVDFDEYVNLMPVSKYKKDKIYQHIIPNSLVNVKWEGDAATNPQIAVLTKTRDTNITEIDFNVWCYDPKFARFYLENVKRSRTFTFISENLKLKYAGSISPKTCFVVGKRVLTDGVHTTEDCFDYKWNIQKQIIPLCYGDSSDPEDNLRVFIFKFSTEVEMNNFTKFWYSKGKKGLSNLLLKGLGKQTGNPEYAIPRVDWSREWTDKEILKDYGYTDEEIKELLK